MTEKAWKKLWTVIGTAALLFGYAAVLRSRGVPMKTEFVDLGSMLPDASSILSFIVLAMLTWLVLLVTRRYAAGRLTRPWSGRFPILYFDETDVDVNTRDGRLYQGIIFIALVICPVLLLVVLYVSFLSYSAYFPQHNQTVAVEYARGIQHLVPATLPAFGELFSGQFRYGTSNGPSYYPVIQPWAYLLALLAILYQFSVTLREVLRN